MYMYAVKKSTRGVATGTVHVYTCSYTCTQWQIHNGGFLFQKWKTTCEQWDFFSRIWYKITGERGVPWHPKSWPSPRSATATCVYSQCSNQCPPVWSLVGTATEGEGCRLAAAERS